METRDWIRFGLSAFVILAIQVLVINNLNLNQYMFPQLYILLLIISLRYMIMLLLL